MYIRSPCYDVARKGTVDIVLVYIINMDCSGVESLVKANFRQLPECFPLPCIYKKSPYALNLFFTK